MKRTKWIKPKGFRRSKTKTNYKKRLWDIFSQFIRLKYADVDGAVKCFTCGKPEHWKEIHAGHYHPRTDGNSLYFDERNVHPQCAGCNVFRRGNLTRYAIKLREIYGENILEELEIKRREMRQIKESEYVELIQTYKDKLHNLELKRSGVYVQ